MVSQAQLLGREIGKLASQQETIKENLAPDDPNAQLGVYFNDDLVLRERFVANINTYDTSSFIIDHPIQGEIDSPVLLIDGGYSAIDQTVYATNTDNTFRESLSHTRDVDTAETTATIDTTTRKITF